MKITSELEQQRLHLPNCWNAIQSAIYQIEKGNPEGLRNSWSLPRNRWAAILDANQQSSKQYSTSGLKTMNEYRLTQRTISPKCFGQTDLEARQGYLKARVRRKRSPSCKRCFPTTLLDSQLNSETRHKRRDLEPDTEDSLPQWANYYANRYWVAEYPEELVTQPANPRLMQLAPSAASLYQHQKALPQACCHNASTVHEDTHEDTNLIAIHAQSLNHQPVTLYWEGESFHKIVERWFNPDAAGGHWRYRLNLGPRLFLKCCSTARLTGGGARTAPQFETNRSHFL